MIILPLAVICSSLFMYGYLLSNILNRQRGVLVSVALLLYVMLIVFEQFYLENFYNMYFNFSDPTGYYLQTRGIDFSQLIEQLRGNEYISNSFYFMMNWVYQIGFVDPTIYGIAIKITNAMIFLCGYILLFETKNSPGVVDLLVLFHPWALMMLVRNVRDAYIVFILSVFLYLMAKVEFGKFEKIMVGVSLVSMAFVRKFFVVPMLLTILVRNYQLYDFGKRVLFVLIAMVVLSSVLYVRWDDIVSKTSSSYLGSAVYFGVENQENVDELLTDNISARNFGAKYVELMLRKSLVAIPVFLFTPHPYNFAVNYFKYRDRGNYVIYTDFDCLLIVLGSVVNYLVVIPVVLKCLFSAYRIDLKFIVIPFSIAIVYSVFLFGNADMRIRYSFIYFLLVATMYSRLSIYRSNADVKYFALSMAVLLLIPFISPG